IRALRNAAVRARIQRLRVPRVYREFADVRGLEACGSPAAATVRGLEDAASVRGRIKGLRVPRIDHKRADTVAVSSGAVRGSPLTDPRLRRPDEADRDCH